MAKKEVTNTEPSKRAHFAWQERVVARTDLSLAHKVVLWRLALHHNIKTGRCDPSYLRLATGVGVSERTAKRAIAKAEQLGLLTVERNGRGSRHDRNHYNFLLEGVSPQTPLEHEGVSGLTTKGCHPRHPNYKANDLLRGRERSASAGAGPDGPPASAGNGSAIAHGHGMEDAVPVGFDWACAAWPRPWADNIKVDLEAYQRALQHADHATILAGLKAHAAAAEDPRFLQPMAKWLDARMWEKKPPTGKTTRRSQSHRRGRSSGGNAFYAEAGYERGADGVLREKGRTH